MPAYVAQESEKKYLSTTAMGVLKRSFAKREGINRSKGCLPKGRLGIRTGRKQEKQTVRTNGFPERDNQKLG